MQNVAMCPQPRLPAFSRDRAESHAPHASTHIAVSFLIAVCKEGHRGNSGVNSIHSASFAPQLALRDWPAITSGKPPRFFETSSTSKSAIAQLLPRPIAISQNPYMGAVGAFGDLQVPRSRNTPRSTCCRGARGTLPRLSASFLGADLRKPSSCSTREFFFKKTAAFET
jgi:hypothetical protein